MITTPDITWIAAGAGQASEPTNWSLGRAPQTGDRVKWTDVSSNNCSWDLDALSVTADGWVIETGYGGTIAQTGVDIGLGELGYDQAGGMVTFDASKGVPCAGPFNHTAGAMTTSRLNLRMTGDGTTLTLTGDVPQSVTIAASVSYSHGTASTIVGLTIESGKDLSILAGKTLYTYPQTYSNNGAINGPGSLALYGRTADATIIIGTVNAPLTILGHATTVDNRIMTLGADTVLGSRLTVVSGHPTYTMTLSHGSNKALTVAGLTTLGTRGVMVQGTAQWSFNGGYTQSGASSVFNQGGPVASGAVAISDGTLNGNTSSWWSDSGSFVQTGGSIGTDLCLDVTGTGNISISGTYFYKLRVEGTASFLTNATLRFGTELAAGASVSIASGKVLIVDYSPTHVFSNQGKFIGDGILRIQLYLADKAIAFGAVLCPLVVYGHSSIAANRTLSMSAGAALGSSVAVQTASATYTTTLDTAGFSLTHRGLTAGTRGAIKLNASKVVGYGNLDTSAGSADFGTSQYVQAGAGTIKTAGASQPFNDLIVRSGAAGSSRLSDIVINGIYAHVPPTSSSAFAITFDPNKEYTGKRRPLKKQLRKAIVWPSLADKLLLEDLEKVSA